MAKKKTTEKQAENAPAVKNATYGLLNDGHNTVSIFIDVDDLTASGIVYCIKNGKQYKFNTELKEV